MERVAKFEKVSQERFVADWLEKCGGEKEEAEKVYADLLLPERATRASAGYDFKAPCDIVLEAGKTILIPTGIRVKMREDYVLMLFPRSSLGFKYRLQLNNTVGIIDSDYYGAENEGHIFARITNDTNEGKTAVIAKGQGFMQGVFVQFGITADDAVDTERTGGIGSTTKIEEVI